MTGTCFHITITSLTLTNTIMFFNDSQTDMRIHFMEFNKHSCKRQLLKVELRSVHSSGVSIDKSYSGKYIFCCLTQSHIRKLNGLTLQPSHSDILPVMSQLTLKGAIDPLPSGSIQ